MTEKDKDKLLTHQYDGIQEYDNDLPLWWRNIFVVTGIFAVLYVAWTHFGFKEPQHEQLARELRELNQLRSQKSDDDAGSQLGEAGLLKLASDNSILAKGKEIFVAKCVACHGANAEGLIGPNLTDQYWIHGGKITDIKHIVRVGVLEKGMLAWQTLMSDDEINSVVAYIWSIRGSHPANPKAPQGELVKD